MVPSNSRDQLKPRVTRDGRRAFVGITDELYLATLGTSALDAVTRVIIYKQRARSWRPWATGAVEIAIAEFVMLTGKSKATVCRALAQGKAEGRIKVTTGGGSGHRSVYAVTRPSDWTHIEGKGLIGETVSDPETVSSPRSDSASPLRNPLREPFTGETVTSETTGLSAGVHPDEMPGEQVPQGDKNRASLKSSYEGDGSSQSSNARSHPLRSAAPSGRLQDERLAKTRSGDMPADECIAGWDRLVERLEWSNRFLLQPDMATPAVVDNKLFLRFRYGLWAWRAERLRDQLLVLLREWLGPDAELHITSGGPGEELHVTGGNAA